MSARLLDFFNVGMNSKGVVYYSITNNTVNAFSCEIPLNKAEDPECMGTVMGILFGAQYSMVTRRVNKTTVTRKSAL